MQATVWINGAISDAQHASISVFDHGFLYGEGIYETLRTYRREPFLFERHMHRLRNSARLMTLTVPSSDEQMRAHVQATLSAQAGATEAYIRILVTRGVGELSYHPAATPVPSLVIIVKVLPTYPAHTIHDGIRVARVSVRRNHPLALNPMIKSNNLINNALAMQEAIRAGAEEALMENQAGEIVECSQSNFFIVRDDVLVTPPLSAGLLPGITREFVMEIARDLGIEAREETVRPDDLASAQEAFITGTTREITPVVHVDDQPIGNARPGPITRRLIDAFRIRVPA